jgi:choline dehydrogenase-like flavoprotein
MTVIETDVCVIGAGICGVLLAQKLKRTKPNASIALLDAGREIFNLPQRAIHAKRFLEYNESPWPRDYVDDQLVVNGESQTMAVGGWALHWEGGCPRFSEEDLRLKSLYGFGHDWPLSWEEMERSYCEAEQAIGVSGDPSPHFEDRQSEPYPMAGMPLSHTLSTVKTWVEKSGLRTVVQPSARNTMEYHGRPKCVRCDICTPICPIGARYSPDFTVQEMLAKKEIRLHSNVLIRRLVLGPTSNRIVAATGIQLEGAPTQVEFRSKLFVMALGKYWVPHLLLISAHPRFPTGLANRTGLVGRYMSGTNTMSARIQIGEQLFQGMHDTNALVSRDYFRCPPNQKYVRHDTRFTTRLNRPKLVSDDGQILIGDALLNRWREYERNAVGVSIRFALHAARDSGIMLDAQRRNRWGDPLPQFMEAIDPATATQRLDLSKHFDQLCHRLIRSGGGRIQWMNFAVDRSIWRSGGCRMSEDPTSGVCDSFGRTFDHENLFVVGAPTLPNPGIGGETLAFVALSLRSAEEIARAL